jgi:hypothetical protein
MIAAALITFALLFLAWLLAPGEASNVRQPQRVEPERAIAEAI